MECVTGKQGGTVEGKMETSKMASSGVGTESGESRVIAKYNDRCV